MYRMSIVALVGAALVGLPALTGCDDKTTTKTEKVEQKEDGTQVKEQKKTTVDHDTGKVETKTEKKVETPNP